MEKSFLETTPIPKLMRKYAVPCVVSLLVAALYNIVDQIFIANASYLGSNGNAANTVVFPLTVIALAVAVMIGDGCCTFVSLSLGRKQTEDASGGIGSAVLCCVTASLLLTASIWCSANRCWRCSAVRSMKKPSGCRRSTSSGLHWASPSTCSASA